MRPYTTYPSDYWSATHNIAPLSASRAETISAIEKLWLGLEEACAFDDRIMAASKQVAIVLELLRHDPYDPRAVRRAWRRFRFPVMADGASDAYERANKMMDVFLSS